MRRSACGGRNLSLERTLLARRQFGPDPLLLALGVAGRLPWTLRPPAAGAPPPEPDLELRRCDPDEVGRGQPEDARPLRLPAGLAVERLARASLRSPDLLPAVVLGPGYQQACRLALAEPAPERTDRRQLRQRVLLLAREQFERIPDQ